MLGDLKTVTQGAQTRTFFRQPRETDNQGVMASYGYDALNRLTSVTYSGARTAPNVAYYYDTGAANAVGRLVSVWSSAGTAQQIAGYDALGRITGSSETIGNTPYGSFSYTYNLADALVSETYPSHRTVTSSYDGANRITGVTGALNGTSKTYVANATYAASGAIGGFNYALTNGVEAETRTFSYNGRMQLAEMRDQAASLFDLRYFYGGAATTGTTPGASTSSNIGSPTGVVEKAQKGSGTTYNFTQTYGYDHLNRLSAASDTGGWTQNFNYDRYGNPWTAANTGLPQDRLPSSNVYNAANNQSSYPGTQYDAAGVGNQTQMGAMQITFDAENRIVQNYNTTAQNSTCYSYDGLGERVAKFAYGGNSCTGTAALTVAYVYDAFGNLAAESQVGSAPTPACLTCYLTWDHLGSVRMVSDAAAGGFTGFHDYAPFGEEVLSNAGRSADWGTAANGTDYLNQRYTGAERDTESTLDFLQARYLANQQGRFVSADPAGNFVADPGNPQSWNLYSYALNNPLAFIDPSGLFTDCPGATVVNNQCIQPPPPPPVDCGVLINSLFNPACGGGVPQGPTITSNPQPPPPPPQLNKPQRGFGSCMENHANDFSVAGLVDNGFAAAGHPGFQPLSNFLGSAAFGNNITGIYFAFFGHSEQSTSNAATTAVNEGLIGDVGVVAAMGQNLTYGRRTSSIFSLNLEGIRGGRNAGGGIGVLPRTVLENKIFRAIAKYGKATTLIDIGLAMAEAIDCGTGAVN